MSRAGAAAAVIVAASLWLASCGPRQSSVGPGDADLARAEDLRVADLEPLLNVLATDTPDRRQRAAVALGRIQSPAAAPALAATARGGESPELRETALFWLGQLGLVQDGNTPPAAAVDAVTAVLTSAPPAPASLLAAAVEALGKLAPPGAESALRPWLRHEDEVVREAAAHALFRLRFAPLWRGQVAEPPPWGDETAAAVGAALADRRPAVRRAAAHACSRWGEARAADALVAALSDEDEWVRLFAVRALGRSGVADRVAAVAALTADPSPRVRAEAVAAVAALGAAERLPPGLDTDPVWHVRAAVARALGGRAQAAPRLAELAGDPSPSVAGAALVALASVEPTVAVERARRHLDGAPWPLRVSAVAAAAAAGAAGEPLVVRSLADRDARVRAAAVGTLGAAHADELRAALADADLAVRGTAVTTLAAAELPERERWLTEAFAASGGEPWIEVRESIVQALAAAGPVAWLATVAAADPAASVRTAAERALAARGEAAPAAARVSPSPSPWLGRRDAPERVEVDTERGRFVIRTTPGVAPLHAAAFHDRVRDGFYDGLGWHRVVSNFVVQGGDPRGDGWGTGDVLLRDEVSRATFDRGTVGMPKAGKDTGGCQLFVSVVPTPHLDGNYTIFGRVVEGLDVLDRLEVGDRIATMRIVRDDRSDEEEP